MRIHTPWRRCSSTISTARMSLRVFMRKRSSLRFNNSKNLVKRKKKWFQTMEMKSKIYTVSMNKQLKNCSMISKVNSKLSKMNMTSPKEQLMASKWSSKKNLLRLNKMTTWRIATKWSRPKRKFKRGLMWTLPSKMISRPPRDRWIEKLKKRLIWKRKWKLRYWRRNIVKTSWKRNRRRSSSYNTREMRSKWSSRKKRRSSSSLSLKFKN